MVATLLHESAMRALEKNFEYFGGNVVSQCYIFNVYIISVFQANMKYVQYHRYLSYGAVLSTLYEGNKFKLL